MEGTMRTTSKLAAATALSAFLSGCYVLPMAPDGTPIWPTPQPPQSHAATPAQAVQSASAGGALPTVLYARLYPSNDIATQTGIVTGTVTNMMTGKGRFQLSYRGETLVGEATRVSGNERKGVASAYGPSGTFMSCDYQMSSPLQGAGSCTFSSGAQYQLHVGN
jgi:hypothetical protein